MRIETFAANRKHALRVASIVYTVSIVEALVNDNSAMLLDGQG